MSGQKYEYSTVKLPNELIAEIEKILEMGLGYTSRADFVKESVRIRIQEIRQGSGKKNRAVHDSLHRIERMLQSHSI